MKRICIICEQDNDTSFSILEDMYYELIESEGQNLQILIPDSVKNQGVFDVFNEPDKDLHVCCLVGGFPKYKIKGKTNFRSSFVNLKEPVETKTVIGRKPNWEFYYDCREWTCEHRVQIDIKLVRMADTVVGLWKDGKDLLEPLRLANHLGKDVVVVDI